ncbi:MAG: hypothetical protein Q8O13_05505 [Candidatus Omnitrophota bacterium]|nr:hypothetical protein [Candidatus Omnitrophota bacterium]
MSPEIKDIIEKLIPAIYTVLGAIVGAGGTIIITVINKKSEEKKQLRELAFKAGIENWKEGCEFAKRQGGTVYPLDMFILNMKLFSEKLLEKKIKKENLKPTLHENSSIIKQYKEFLKEGQQTKIKEEKNNL